MFFHGADQADTDMQEDSAEKSRNGDKSGKSGGDGLHHHEIHEDEGGGFHSVHTHPDGTKEHDDHATYDDAKASMDQKFGHGDSDGEESGDDSGDGGDMNTDDIAGSYGRSCD